MASFDDALQVAVYSALAGDATLRALVGDYDASGALVSAVARVFDAPPEDAAFPFVEIGSFTASPFEATEVEGEEVFFEVKTWSAAPGAVEARAIMKRIGDLLHDADLAVAGAKLANLRQTFRTSGAVGDGVVSPGVQRFRALVTL